VSERSGDGAANGGPRVAFWLETPSLPACEIARLLGYDGVILDFEHGVLPIDAADRLTQACNTLGLVVLARVASPDRVAIQHALDAGADGVILPQIAGLDHAREATAFAKYPPLGSRGVGYSRAMGYGDTPEGFFEAENKRTICWPMIETPGALTDVEAILALDTVDGVFIGPSDLSMTRGRGHYKGSDADFGDMERIAAAAGRAGKGWAMPAPGAKAYDFAVRHGACFVTVSDDLTALRLGFAQGLRVGGRG
jgi:2-dehydro-3-deoxyglucarate aldolase/4-hydroxy-2-oxoheptanedioate aldolase